MAVGVVVALTATLEGSAALAAPSPAAGGTAAGGSVVELDLSGVRTDLLATLPDPRTVPDAEGGQVEPPASAGPGAARPDEAAPEIASRAAAGSTEALPATGDASDPTTGATPSDAPAPTDDAHPTGGPTPTATVAGPDEDAPAATAAPGVDPDVLTGELDTRPFSVFGVTWDDTPGTDDVTVRYRVRTDGTWSEWTGLDGTDVAPDTDAVDAEDSRRDGTDPVVALGSDGLQLWAQAGSGTVRNLTAVLVDPGSDAAAGADPRQLAAAAGPGRPAIIARAGWGADESLRTCQPDYSPTVRAAAVHHTASSNAYSPEDVPGIIRGFYAYHTRAEPAGGRGWCDVGYNFLVDRFGRVWEGRAGGVTSTVVGVHTGGFNSRTFGVAAIGNLSAAAPTNEMVVGIADLIAWKFSVHGIRANTSVALVSGGGASKYPAGQTVVFDTVFAHRDAALTSCPGDQLYSLLPAIRDRAASLANAAVGVSPQGALDGVSGSASGVSVRGWAFDPESSAALRIDVSVDGAVTSITADQPRPDVASAYGVGPSHGFSGTVQAGGGRHVVCVSAANLGSGTDTVLGCDVVTVSNATPVGSLDAARATDGGVYVGGWALDPDTTDSIDVHVYVDGVGTALRADASRPDVGAAYGRGDRHGFGATIPASQGSHQVCVYLINRPAGVNVLLACRVVTLGQTPIGSLDLVRGGPSGIVVGGWAFDPDTSTPVDVHVYVDGRATVLRADGYRPDVGAAYRRGDRHGFNGSVAAADGTHQVCLYLINQPSGTNPLLGCRTVVVANATPVGSWDLAVGVVDGVRVAGWTLDPDTDDPIDLHVYVDGRATVVRADRARPDVAALYRRGERHGFDTRVDAASGAHDVCLYAINAPAGTNPLLGCRVVRVP